MQPTVQSQARLRRLVWALGLLLITAAAAGGLHVHRLNGEISRLGAEFGAREAALEDLRRQLANARQAATTAAAAERRTRDQAQIAEEARTRAEMVARTADTVRQELEAKLKAAEAARADAEAKLREATEKKRSGTED